MSDVVAQECDVIDITQQHIPIAATEATHLPRDDFGVERHPYGVWRGIAKTTEIYRDLVFSSLLAEASLEPKWP